MSDVATASCAPAADGTGLDSDGIVSITVDGATTVHAGLADGDHQFTATGTDVAFAIDAAIACDAEPATATVVVVGVGTPPLVVEAATVSLGAAPAAVQAAAAGTLPATGLAGGAALGAALVLVGAGSALRRLARRHA